MVAGGLSVGCTGDGGEPADEPPDPAAIAAELGLDDLDLDDVIVMQRGGFAPPPDIGMPDGQIVQQRHVLRTTGPAGPIDLFEMVIAGGEFSGVQRCQSVVFADGGMGMGCAPLNEAAGAFGPDATILTGASGSDDFTVFELAGPAGTTHLVVDQGDRRVAVVAVADRGLLVSPGPFCENPPTRMEAWMGEELLLVQDDQTMC